MLYFLLIIGIIVTSSIQGILIPKIVSSFQSMYLLLLIIAGIFAILLTIIHGIFVRQPYKPKYFEYVVYIAMFNTFESVAMIYSANPSRTPILIQTILVGIVILPTAFLTRYYLQKQVVYKQHLIIPSIIFLIASLVISSLPLYSEWHWMSILWISLYAFGVVSISFYNIMQEKSMIVEDRHDATHKLSIITYAAVLKFLFIIPLFPVEWLFLDDPLSSALSDIEVFKTNWMIVIGFCVTYTVTCILAVNLNSLSTNMNMISSTMVNIIVMTYYSIFPPANSVRYPLLIIIACMILNVHSIVFWHFGETRSELP